jgi:hypothetical protein
MARHGNISKTYAKAFNREKERHKKSLNIKRAGSRSSSSINSKNRNSKCDLNALDQFENRLILSKNI